NDVEHERDRWQSTIDFYVHRWQSRGSDRPTAIMAWHDGLACDLITAMREQGISVPGDVSVVGVDDIDAATETQFHLTTVRNPLDEISRRATAIVLNRVEDPTFPIETIKLPPKLVIRQTTGPYARM
ncbi:MAG TPA: LacI family DNA-binding transcriptional regulator, partial [Fimbriimonas sp.]|nr:LacI family DNA-binding transcriptional regulator [Fimbriimonas sp.]